jgi:hypothetical protein
LADTGNAHQSTTSVGCSDHSSYVRVDRHDRGEDGGARRNQTLHGSRQAGDALAGLQRPPNEARAQCAWQPDTEHHGKPADLVFQSDPLADQFLARDDQRPDGVRWQRFHMNRLEEAGAGEMRQAAGIVPVGLVGR